MSSQSAPSSNERQWRARRRYARVPILAPVDIYTKDTVGPPLTGRIDNLSVGGVLTSCRERFDLQTELAMLFQLPTGFRIHAFGRVIYVVPERHFGVAFIDLDQEAQLRLEEFTQKVLGYARRSSRVPYRTHLTIRSLDGAGSQQEESADSVLVSRNGGLLVWLPEKECSARARVVFQHVWSAGGLVEVGVEFLSDEDFWKIDFASEYD
jgi:hypothetical protein